MRSYRVDHHQIKVYEINDSRPAGALSVVRNGRTIYFVDRVMGAGGKANTGAMEEAVKRHMRLKIGTQPAFDGVSAWSRNRRGATQMP